MYRDMKIRVRYAEYIRIEEVENGGTLEIEEGTTVRQLLQRLTMEEQYRDFFHPIIDKQRQSNDYVLREGDDLLLYLPSGGG